MEARLYIVFFAHFFSPHLFNRSPDFRNLPHAPPYCKRSSIQKTKEETTEAKDFLRRKHETVRPQAPEYRRKPDFSQKELVSVLAMTEPEIMFTDSSKFKKGEMDHGKRQKRTVQTRKTATMAFRHHLRNPPDFHWSNHSLIYARNSLFKKSV